MDIAPKPFRRPRSSKPKFTRRDPRFNDAEENKESGSPLSSDNEEDSFHMSEPGDEQHDSEFEDLGSKTSIM